jgi:hypothetical protein
LSRSFPALFGASTPLAKLLLGSVNEWMLAGLLYLGCGLGLAAVFCLGLGEGGSATRGRCALARRRRACRRRYRPGAADDRVEAHRRLRRHCLNLEGLATIAIAWVVFRENADLRMLVGAVAILLAAMLLSWQP